MKLKCPTEQLLREFLEGALNHAESDRISDHIDNCSDCDLAMSALERSHDDLIKEVRHGLRIESMLQEPELRQLRNQPEARHSNIAASGMEPGAKKGKRLRDYRLVKKIGEGGMGTVYQAVHIHLGKSVAIKILPTDKLQSRNAVERFRREMRAVGKVNHRNVVSASDAGAVDGQHFLVMELVEGADLARIIHDRGSLKVADACEIVRQAANGIQHAHDIGLVHRDVKPSNLMLSLDGNVKLLDLGLASLNQNEFDSAATVAVTDQLTSVGQIMGTLDFMAPEQITASPEVDGRADVYALGATLFQLLTGKTPCGDRSQETPRRIEAVLHDPPLDIQELRGDIPSGLAALLNKALSKRPQDRPQSASDFAKALNRFTAEANLKALAEACRTSLDMPSADIDVTDDVSLVVAKTKTIGEVRRRSPWLRPAGIAGIGLVAIIALGLLLTVFTFRTTDGVVQIEIPADADAGNIRVALEQHGETVKIADGNGNWEVRVSAGDYDVKLLGGDDEFFVEDQSLQVTSNGKATVRIKHLVDPIAIFRRREFKAAAEAAEQLVAGRPDHGWYHAQAAMLWGASPLFSERERYEKHRAWLANRWKETGEGANTIPRVCCLYPGGSADLQGMLEAVVRESKEHPKDWRYPHSRMMLLCRLGKYREALAALHECRRLSPTNPMHSAVDHAWFAWIHYHMGEFEAGNKDQAKALEAYGELFQSNGNGPVPDMWFDFIELGVILCELSVEDYESQYRNKLAPAEPQHSLPYSVCTDDLQLIKWGSFSKEIMDADLSSDGTTAVFAVGWRPGTWECWRLDESDPTSLLVEDQAVTRHVGGQPIRSVAIHPTEPIVALGRWYGAVDIVDRGNGQIRITHETSIGKLRKANGVEFVEGGDQLLISYQSNRLIDWNWTTDKVMAQHTFDRPLWEVFPAGDKVLVGNRLWNRKTGNLTEPLVDDNTALWLSPNGDAAFFSTGPTLRVFDIKENKTFGTFVYDSDVKCVAFLPDTSRFITGHRNGELRITNFFPPSGHSLIGKLHSNHEVGYIKIDASGQRLLTVSGKPLDSKLPGDYQVAVWNLSENLNINARSPEEQIRQQRQEIREKILGETTNAPAVEH